MILTHTQQGRRAAFTLVELLVVIGLMAVLATISVAGYSAASRGMADRGVIQTTVSILRVAQQTCQIDRVPTKVMFFNQKLDTGQEDEADLFQGTAIAIKQAGRITMKPSSSGASSCSFTSACFSICIFRKERMTSSDSTFAFSMMS